MNYSSYYPFGMLMPGRTLSTEEYRFGFNGKENLDEVKGVGKVQDFGARIYDSRISRWLSTDSYYKKYPEISPYCSFENSPITITDPSGDTTVYFSKSGKYLFTSFDKLPAALTIISDKYLKIFAVGLVNSLMKENSSQNSSPLNNQWRTLGKTYDINSFRVFYNKNTVEGVDNLSPNSPTGYNLPGYFNESRSYIYEKDGLLKPGNEVAKGFIDYVTDFPKKELNAGKVVGKSHLHANEGESAGYGTYDYGPSPDDLRNKWVSDVIVGSKNMYFYGKENNLISIDKSTLKPVINEKK